MVEVRLPMKIGFLCQKPTPKPTPNKNLFGYLALQHKIFSQIQSATRLFPLSEFSPRDNEAVQRG
jgi:hypothetical protein